jgi:hypothetical protein
MTKKKSLLRQKTPPAPDPMTAAVWAAAIEAATKISAVLDATPSSDERRARLHGATALTPSAVLQAARTKPPMETSFNDYLAAVRVSEALAEVLGQPTTDAAPQWGEAVVALSLLSDEVAKYAVHVRRARTVERLSGNDSPLRHR